MLVLPNLYGDIVSELCAGIIGGLGVAPGVNIGGDGALAVFEATHGRRRELAGTNRANPMALMLSGAMLLRHIGETDAGDRLEAAVVSVLLEGVSVPRDLRAPGDDRLPAGTFQAADAVIAAL